MTDYLTSLAADSAALATAARAAGLDAEIPKCPGWRVGDLVGHVFMLHRWVEIVVRTRATSRPDRDETFPEGGALLDAFESTAAALIDTLRQTPVDAPVWNWSATQPHTAGFWRRRMAQETAVHRWDAQSAAGTAMPIDAAFAVDGIEEVLDVFLPSGLKRFPDLDLPGTLHLHCTDTEGEWLVAVADGAVRVERSHGKGDAAVRGTASDVLLYLWNRVAPSDGGIETFGDESVLAAWRKVSI